MRHSGAALVAAGSTGFATTASADDHSDEPDRLALTLASARGGRASIWERYFGSRSRARRAALDTQAAFNPHSDEWVAYINVYAPLDSDLETFALEFAPGPDEKKFTAYLLARYNDAGELSAAKIAEDTDRDVDETVRLESIAADNAADEIRTGYEEFVEPGNPPDQEHLAYLAGKYRFGTDYVTSTLLGDDL